MKRPLVGTVLFVSANLLAADLEFVGTESATWDHTTANWTNATGAAVAFSDGDNVTIGRAFTGSSLTLGDWLKPSDVVFDNAQDITLGKTGNGAFAGTTKSLTKRGSGTLRLKSMWNYNACDWHVYGGTLAAADEWVGDNNTFGDTSQNVTIHVHDGATLEEPSNKTLGYDGDTAEAENHAVNVTVYAGGLFRPGRTGQYEYPFATVKDLAFDGGAFDFTKQGYWGKGLLKVTRKLAFDGSTPYVLNRPSGNAGKIAFAASRATEICVADITGDESADLTISTENIGRITESAVVGLTKTGAGTLLWNAKIHNSYDRGDWAGWLGLNGPITVTAGKLILANAANEMAGRLEVSGGELWLGADQGREWFVPTNTCFTYAGNLQVEGREIVASGTGKLILSKLCMFGADPPAEGATPGPVTLVACENGEIHIDTPSSTGDYNGYVVIPNLRLEGAGRLVVHSGGYWSKGAVSVLGTFAFAGSTPVTVAANQKKCDMMTLNGNSGTTFNVADITGDGAADAIVRLPMGRTGEQKNAGTVVGFHKTGAGTLCLAFDVSGLGAAGLDGLNGTLAIDAGTLQYACDLRKMSFAVAAGAFLQPCAEAREKPFTVMGLTVAEGGGFRVAVGDKGRIHVTGSLVLPTTGVCDIHVPSDASAEGLKATFLSVAEDATVDAPADFSGWTFTVNGSPSPAGLDWKISRRGNQFVVRPARGLYLMVR